MAFQKITQRKDGRYCANVLIGEDPITGKVKRKMVYGSTKTEVKNKIKELEKEIAQGHLIPTMRSRFTVSDWCKEWLDTFASRLSKNSFTKYKGYIDKYIIPYLGSIELSKLNTLQCQQFTNKLIDYSNLHSNTVNHLIICFKTILNKAVEIGFITRNPATGVIIPKKIKADLNPFSEDEALEFINLCSNTTIDNLCKFALFSGLRAHEIMALTWNNLEGSEITVDHQFNRDKRDKNFYPTKNKRSRKVYLSDSALNILNNQRLIQAQSQISYGKKYRNNLNLIFTDKYGDRLHINTVRRHFKEICEKLGREDVRFHDLRHTYAVLSLKAGVDTKTISEALGHHSVAFTLDQYAYVTENMRKESALKLEKYLQQF